MQIKVSAVQFSPKGSAAENADVIAEKIAECARQGARIAVFQECAVTGYDKKVIRETTSSQIEEAEKKIELLAKKADGSVKLEPFEQESEAEEAQEGKLF